MPVPGDSLPLCQSSGGYGFAGWEGERPDEEVRPRMPQNHMDSRDSARRALPRAIDFFKKSFSLYFIALGVEPKTLCMHVTAEPFVLLLKLSHSVTQAGLAIPVSPPLQFSGVLEWMFAHASCMLSHS